MTQNLKVALFVEGSLGIPDRNGVDSLVGLWRDVIAVQLQLRRIDRIIPISKVELTMMDTGSIPRSSGKEPFDARLARELGRAPFDAAVVAWDLLPEWGDAQRCRWNETKNLFRLLGESKEETLAAKWKEKARARFENYEARPSPPEGAGQPVLEEYSILPVCMEADFEALLMIDETVIRRCLGVEGHLNEWPAWPRLAETRKQKQKDVLQKAITSARHLKTRKPSGDMKTNGHEWAAYFFKALFESSRSKDKLLNHPLAIRLQRVLSADRTT